MIDIAALLAPFNRNVKPTRWAVFDRAVTLVGSKDVRVAEVGVSPHYGNGLSTVYWAQDERVASVLAIDINQKMIDGLIEKIGEIPKVKYVAGHSVAVLASLPNNSLDLLYLDGDVNPWQTVHEYMAAVPKLRPGAIVLVDDLGAKTPILQKLVNGEQITFSFRSYGFWGIDKSPLIEEPLAEPKRSLLLFRHMGDLMIKCTDKT